MIMHRLGLGAGGLEWVLEGQRRNRAFEGEVRDRVPEGHVVGRVPNALKGRPRSRIPGGRVLGRVLGRTWRGLVLRYGLALAVGGVSSVAVPCRGLDVHDAFGLEPVGRGQGAWLDDDLRRPAAPVYDVVALRVEFQPDTTRFTTGDGTFASDLYEGLQPAVDPMPHDAAYFQAHLDFLEHYVARVSDGKTTVRTHLIPAVVRLPRTMGTYAPTGPDADSDVERRKLARLVHDAWSQADAEVHFDVSRFVPERTALVIFHAGVGRDVEMTGTVLDKTPEDLPSIFFDAPTLNRLGVSGLSFNGFPVDYSMIVPRTETRFGVDFISGDRFLLELSINGMLAASFFNFLGVPDLFDVESGESAIGPFGLMDAQGIFAYGGLFPPEPMAWTKHYLGWTTPVDLSGGGPQTVHLRAASQPDGSESARAFISEAEYFLVENRYRDPEHDGLTMRIWNRDGITEQRVENGDERFNNVVIEGFAGGVVVGVDNYDWALPGGVDQSGNVLNGGMLIWHVDERRLRSGLRANAVNVGKERAIDLEEADGAQDIGHPSEGLFGSDADRGTPFDFFYAENPVGVRTSTGRDIRLYENRFGPDTRPGSEANAGGSGFIVLEDFSTSAPDMSMVYRRESRSGVTPFAGPEVQALDGAFESLSAGSKLFASESHLLLYESGEVAVARWGQEGPPRRLPSEAIPAMASGERLATLERSTPSGEYRLVVRHLRDGTEAPGTVYAFPRETAGALPASPIVHDGDAFHVLMRGPAGVRHVRVSPSGAQVVSGGGAEPVALAIREGPEGGIEPVVFRAARVAIGRGAWSYALEPSTRVGQPVVGRELDGTVAVLPLIDQGALLLLTPGGAVRHIDVRAAVSRALGVEGTLSSWPVLVDLDGDGHLDVLVPFGSSLFACTRSGAMLRGFPVRLPDRVSVQPLVLGSSEEQEWIVLAADVSGRLHAVDGQGHFVEPFPLEVGHAVHTAPVLVEQGIIAASATGSVLGWRLPSLDRVWWGTLYGSDGNGSFVAMDSPVGPSVDPLASGLIDVDETYNWPNPIEAGVTHLRVRTMRDARVEVKIVDAGGRPVGDVDVGVVEGGVPTEVVWKADVQSGLYFARFTATAPGGERATKLIKMAVIR